MYSNIRSFDDIRKDKDCFCGLALGEESQDGDYYTHVVFLYRFDGQLKGIHYKNNQILSENTGRLEERQYIAIKAHKAIAEHFPDEESQSIIKTLCENILCEKEEVLFSFNYSNQCFKTNGKLLREEDACCPCFGLTCTTLILALFKSEDMGELDLLDIESWEVNDDDHKFIEKIYEIICMGLDDETKKHAEYIKSYHRYRPEDVGIAFLSGNIPCNYTQCRSEYDTLYQKITEC